MDTNSQVVTTSPLVSIIMLTYNRAAYIRLALDSALCQTYHHFEIIILDDGSTDNTAEVVAQFSDPRIRYIKDSTNKGLFVRRKESLAYVTGEFVAILDSDDIWTDPQKLEKQLSHLVAHPDCAVVGTFITLIDAAGAAYSTTRYHTEDKEIRAHLLIRNQFANSSVVMRKSMLDKTAGYRDFAPCEDLELFLQLGKVGTFANLPITTVGYRVHAGSESARKTKVARQILRLVQLHRHAYPGYYVTVCKMHLLIIGTKLGLA